MTDKPLSHIKLQIGCPVGDYRLDLDFTTSVYETASALEHFGAKVDFAKLPGCSDLPAARAKILGNFYRSDNTHLLMVDSDMSWNHHDVMRMLSYNLPFIAGVGMRKIVGPSEFALNNCDDAGNTAPMLMSADGTIEVSEVGMAFVLINRECATKMIEHYKNEFEFEIIGKDLPGGKVMEVDVFSPMIIPGTKRRLPEDYAFCYRWRKIGGKVIILPDIFLGHAGRFVWKGRWSDSLQRLGDAGE